jgi:hypothetical protein
MPDALVDMVDTECNAIGARFYIEERGKHRAIVLCMAGRPDQRVFVSKTASDHRALLNMRGDVRRTLRRMNGHG